MRKLPLWMALATVLGVSSAAAQVYPSRTVKIVVPLPPGATADILPRIIADKLTLKWAHPRDYREPARCRTKPRRRDCRQGGSRRLHAACHAAGSTCHQSALLSETRLRSGGVRSCHHHGHLVVYAGCQPEGAGIDPAGANCLCKSQP